MTHSEYRAMQRCDPALFGITPEEAEAKAREAARAISDDALIPIARGIGEASGYTLTAIVRRRKVKTFVIVRGNRAPRL